MRRFLLFPWFLAVAMAQQEPARLEGKTVNVTTREPLRKVNLTLRPAANPGQGALSVTSGDDGKFSFSDLSPGSYRLSAERAGFVRQEYGARGNSPMGTTLTVAPGQQVKDLEFKLVPQGVISGKVLDDDGEPALRAAVSVMRQMGRGSRGRPI